MPTGQPEYLSYVELVMLAQSDDEIEWHRGLHEFMRRCSARKFENRFVLIELDHLADLYGMNRERMRAIWAGRIQRRDLVS